ncbi:ImmA/IrrE family metallo-endopeptidase [Enterococcus pseudoavium]|mgnify:CR=1 FL=1|uniref:ImmA/IrrE family metallo-endopeptidase n=2 Tax=Enterococcus TaxID=1350 RepID=A0ABU3FIV1_9ENTE|nr:MULTISPECIES: ImmA/IrrE family metallo-endopeptidase [Enterococcus]MDT2634982.1 ImmA/IrrE family metallo-endopeptidase [Enterococcus dongliensis]MDT2636210.1 ImmA/IrrE family metallo-endopeptidase [Enterococcus dongliensis]MDT2643021.1 ImmA/IrrE family metallo-endopeptidase [Enterococcus dongliensis]MDT2770990.1 ImmA/IrrE family metallo-endopeptidase [Enterococcus pseudoavium]
MNDQIKMIIDELKVGVIDTPALDSAGKYIADINTIVLDGRLSEFDRAKALLHELGHASKHHKNYRLYNVTYSLHLKMEYEADHFMIESLVTKYLSNPDIWTEQVNYMKFIEDCGIDTRYESLVKELFTEYIFENSIAL